MCIRDSLLFATEECELDAYLSEYTLDDYFDEYETQILKFARTMYQKGSDDKLEQVVEWIEANPIEDYDYINVVLNEQEWLENLKKAMRPQQQENN